MIKKETLKGFAAGVLVTTLLVSSIATGFAASVTRNISVTYNNIKVMVDGAPVQFSKDAAGKTLEPFVHNGRTYLPVGDVAKAVGKSVVWDGATQTVHLNSEVGQVPTPAPSAPTSGTRLTSMDYFSSSQSIQWGHYDWEHYKNNDMKELSTPMADNTGTEYSDGLSVYLKGSGTGATYGLKIHREYLINRQFNTFEGVFALSHKDRSNIFANSTLRIYGDDALIYTSSAVGAGDTPVPFSVNVSGVNKLKIEVTNLTELTHMSVERNITYLIGNPVFK